MPTFAQRITSDDRIGVEPAVLHAVLRDPAALADLTPLVEDVAADGDRWRWQLTGITALGISAAPSFTTLMDIGPEVIAFRPDPDRPERASATGAITVSADGPGHALVAIDLTATVELPLPRVASRAVQSVMFTTMRAGGTRFAENLLRHLGDPPHRGLDVRSGRAALGR